MIRLALAALLAPALAFSQGTPERILSPAEANQKVRGIWAEIRPKLDGLGLGPYRIFDPDPGADTGSISFIVMSEHRDGTYTVGTGPMASGESQWIINGKIYSTSKFIGNESADCGTGTWFDLAPGARGIIRIAVEEGWIVKDQTHRGDNSLPSYHATGGGIACFRRGLVVISVDLLRAGTSVTKSYKGGWEYHDVRKQETKEIYEAAIPDIKALARRMSDLIPPSALGDTGPRSKVELALLDPNRIYDSRRPTQGRDTSDLPGFSATYLETLSRLLKTDRIGATADGVSLLLVRAIVPEAGTVTFSLDGAAAGGTLHGVQGRKWSPKYPFDDAGAASVEVNAAPLDGSETIGALALYKPPADFGPGREERFFTLKAAFTAKGPAKSRGEATISLTVVRPPVVLVHGTYDDPTECWTQISPGAPAGNTIAMVDRLKQEAFRTFLIDYKESSGRWFPLSDGIRTLPSTFDANQQMLWAAPGGIHEALEAFRKDGFAATRADVICHSLGGVLARVYLRGSLPDPRVDVSRWGPRRDDNYLQGDVNRLVTISSTHRGSEVMELFDAYSEYSDSKWNLSSLWTQIFMSYVDYIEQPITTGAPVDQIPGSAALRSVGPTRVRAHAISCISSDEDLGTYGGTYLGRAEKLWGASTAESLKLGVGVHLRNPAAAERLVAAKAAEQALQQEITNVSIQLSSGSTYPAATNVDPALVEKLAVLRAQLARTQLANALAFRTVVFRGENDCTVSLTSSSGGLKPPYQTTIGHVLHGFATQYPSVQERVLELLRSEGDALFAPDGFPDTYAQKPGRVPTWGQLLVPPPPAPAALAPSR